MRCFFCENIGSSGSFANLAEREELHLFKILRAKTGETIELIDGRGCLASAEVEERKKIRILSRRQLEEPILKLHLFVSPPRHKKMDDILAQAAELGVWSVTPVTAERSVSKSGQDNATSKWEIHLIEGCKQAHNPFLPTLNSTTSLEDAAAKIKKTEYDAFFGSVKENISNFIRQPTDQISNFEFRISDFNVAWIVGPEGGFTEREEKLMLDSGFKPLRIGRWIMRVETAAATGAALLIHNFKRKN